MNAYNSIPVYLGYPGYYSGQSFQQQPNIFQNGNTHSPAMTPPTIRAEIVQVENEDAAARYPVGVGASQMMMARDESAIYIKTGHANEPPALDVYVKRPPAPQKPTADLSEYIRKDEFEAQLTAFLAAKEKERKEDAE